MKHILLAYDGSEQAEKAFDQAIDFANKYKAELTVLAVARLPEPPEDIETEAVLEAAQQHYENLFAHLKQKADPFLPLKLNFKIEIGNPAEQIVYQAEKLGVDHIVMGHRGQTFFHRWLLGSVAKQVMIYAHCAITIVR
jgi:nucleotide-binding universal stress UspA family protein